MVASPWAKARQMTSTVANVRPTDTRGTPGTRTRPWKAARRRHCVARVHLAVMNRLALTAAGVAVLAAFQTRQLLLRDGLISEFFFPTRGVSCERKKSRMRSMSMVGHSHEQNALTERARGAAYTSDTTKAESMVSAIMGNAARPRHCIENKPTAG